MKRRWKIALGVVALLAAVMVTLPLVRNRESYDRAELAQAHPELAHSFLDAPAGTTHYELMPGRGDIVVMVHGVSGPMNVWDRTCAALHEAGRSYVRVDLYGRGLSARLDSGAYDLPTYRDQVLAVVEHVTPGKRVHLVGSSMGALVVSEVAKSLGAARVRSVTFMGPAGFRLEATPASRAIGVPLLGDWMMTSFGDALLRKHQRRYFVQPDRFEAQHAVFDEQLRVRGSKRAILETMRRVPLQRYEDGYRALAATAIPAIAFWGEDDQAFPFVHAPELRRAMPALELVPISRAGHLPQLERDDLVSPRFLAWLEAHEAL